MAQVERGFIRTQPDGEVYAVEYENGSGEITGACGPLYFTDVRAAELPNYHYHDNPELVDWLMSETFAGIQATASYTLLSAEDVERIEQSAEAIR